MESLAEYAEPQAIALSAKESGCRSVAFTYNDPVVFWEYAGETARHCHALGIKTVSVTAGYMCPEPRAEFYREIDAANVDLKAFSEKFYHQQCAAHLEPVLDTLRYLKHDTSVWLEITTLLIPGLNDSEQELDQLSAWIAKELGPAVPLHFTAFHPDYHLRDIPATSAASLTVAREIARKNGLRYVYTGNVHDPEGGSTFCHACGRKLIGRDWYAMSEYNLSDQGHCRFCGTPCAGVFEGPPGKWGAKRAALKIPALRHKGAQAQKSD